MKCGGPWRMILRATLALALLLPLVTAQPCGAVRICTYNILNWPGSDWYYRQDEFQLVMDAIDADLIIVQEIQSQLGVARFLNVLNASEPDEYWFMPFVNGNDTDNACFYKVAVFDSIFHEQIPTTVRETSVYRLGLDGYESSAAEITILSTHLKAGSSSSDQATRLTQTTVIRNYLNEYPLGEFFILGGDFNIRGSTESAYQMMVGYLENNNGRVRDPIGRPGYWHDSYTYRDTHSQATTDEWGGMDDRFDQLLVSYSLDNGEGWDYLYGTYTAYGNDGLRLNNPINDPPNQIITQELADALAGASDHVPVYADFQIPAKIGAPTELAFGQAIVGATATELLSVSNVAVAPADLLSYTLTAPDGFTAPGGTFEVGAGSSGENAIGMDTATPGALWGGLVIVSNDFDDPEWDVQLSGTVVDHAQPSLSSEVALLEDTLDFGAAPPGMFDDMPLPVYNYGYGDFQALLDVYDAFIDGGDGRFSFVGGFTEQTAGADPAEYEIAFDSATAEMESLYTATIIFSTQDPPGIPGGTGLDDLTVHVRAYVTEGTSVPDDEVRALALGPGMPNPFTDRTALRLSLPAAERAVVEVYDITGRLVRTLQAGIMPAGEHRIVWDGRDDRGKETASGIYFCRAQVGEWREARKLVLLK